MIKIARLKLKGIKYTGASIGDDIRIEIECLDVFFGLNKKVKSGAEVNINTEIGQFFVDQTLFSLLVDIKVIERDIIYNDVGSAQVKLKINLDDKSPQTSTHKIEVKERRGLLASNRTAIFYVTIEALVAEAILFVPDTDDGWLVGHREDIKEDVSLPTHLKVRLDNTELKREYITVLEGPLQGVQLWLSLNKQGRSYLLPNNPQTGPVSLTYSISKKILQIGRNKYLAADDKENPWKAGVYDVEIPDAPHRGGINYPNVRYAKVWFRIGHNGARYLHIGQHSAGCITLIEQEKWDGLCKILLKARKGDGKSVGVLSVID